MNERCESEGNRTVKDRMFRNRCPRQYENGDGHDSREGSLPKENQEVLGSLIRLSNVLKGTYSPSQGLNGATTSLGWMTVGSYWTSSRSPLFFVSMPKQKFRFQLQGAHELHVTEQRWFDGMNMKWLRRCRCRYLEIISRPSAKGRLM